MRRIGILESASVSVQTVIRFLLPDYPAAHWAYGKQRRISLCLRARIRAGVPRRSWLPADLWSSWIQTDQMDTAYLRRCVNLHRPQAGPAMIKQITQAGIRLSMGLFISILVCGQVSAQSSYKYVRKHLERYDDKTIHYGFFFAMPVTRFSVTYSPAFLTADSARRIYSPNKPAFRVGFVVNTFLDNRFDLRLTPSYRSLAGRSTMTIRGAPQKSKAVNRPGLIFLCCLNINPKGWNRGDVPDRGWRMGIESNVRKQGHVGAIKLNTRATDFAVEYGVGFEQFFQFFKFAPELRFSHGLVNLYNPGTNASSVGISRLTSHTVTLYLNFE